MSLVWGYIGDILVVFALVGVFLFAFLVAFWPGVGSAICRVHAVWC